MPDPLLSVRDLRIEYRSPLRQGLAVDGLDFTLAPGEVLALVGESGCGKSTTALALMGLLPADSRVSGQALFGGRNLVQLAAPEFRALRGRQIGMIFQEPMTSLNPVYTVGQQLTETLRAHLPISQRAARARALELLDLVAIPEPQRRIDSYPHELSGGQRQRVMIAMAIALGPALLIADEPTTALDVTIQGQILELLDRLRREMDMALLLISHDLPLVAQWTDRVLVMHHGREMEALPAADLFAHAQHPYTQGLIGASIRLGGGPHHSTARLAEIRSQREPDGVFSFELRPASPRAPAPPQPATPLLTARNLVVSYRKGLRRHRAVDDVSLSIARGETLGLVGESGCGKSSLSRALMRLTPLDSGTITLAGQDLSALRGSGLRQARSQIQMVFQDPYASLNPRHSVQEILAGVLAAQGGSDAADRARRIAAAVSDVGLPRSATERYPHEFSGGQRQRIAIARALILRPALVICDEPVSALDVSVQAQILNLLGDLRAEHGFSYLFISHDLAVVQYISDRVAVMQAGRIVEQADHDSIWQAPTHPYTRQLIEAAL